MIRSKDNFLQVSDGAWIYFEDYGKDKGEPIMILHVFLCQKRFKISLWTAVPRMFMNSLSIWAWRM